MKGQDVAFCTLLEQSCKTQDRIRLRRGRVLSRNNDPADFGGAVRSTIFAFNCYHFKYDDLIDLLHKFQLLRKTALPGL
jgi:hypothetical protein